MKKLFSILSILAAASVTYAQTNKFIAVGWNTNNAPVGSVPFVRSATSNGWTAGAPGESYFLSASNLTTPYPHFQPIYGSNIVGGVASAGSSNVFLVVSNLTATNTWVSANISDSNVTTVATITADGNPYDIRWDTHMQTKWDGTIDANVRLATWFTYTDIFGVSTTNMMYDLIPMSASYLSYHIETTYPQGGNARPDVAVNTDYGWTAGSAFFMPKSNTSITISALRVGSYAGITTGGATNIANYYFTSIGNGSGSSSSGSSGSASNVFFLDSPSISWSQIGGSNYAQVTTSVTNAWRNDIIGASNMLWSAKVTTNLPLTLLSTNQGSSLSNTVDLIAGSNVTITTNANKRSFTIASTGGGSSISNTVARQEYFYTNTANLFRSNQFTFSGGGMSGQTGYAPGASYANYEYVIDFTTSVQGNPDFLTATQLFHHISLFATNQLATGHTPAGISQAGALQTAGYAYHSDFNLIELAFVHFRKTDHPFIFTNFQANLSNALNYVQRSNNIPSSFGTNANLYDGWGLVEIGYNSYSAAHYKRCCDLMAIMAMKAGQPLVASNYFWQAQVIRSSMTNLWDETRGLLRTCSQGATMKNTHSLAANALAVLYDAADDRIKNRIEEEFVKFSGHNNGFFQYGALRTTPIGECLDAAIDSDCDGTDGSGTYQTGGYWPLTWGVEVVARRNPDLAEAMMKDMYSFGSQSNQFYEWWNVSADLGITAVNKGSSNYLNSAGIPATYLLTGKLTDTERLLLRQAGDNAVRPNLGLVAGSNITLTPGATGVSIASTGGSGSGIATNGGTGINNRFTNTVFAGTIGFSNDVTIAGNISVAGTFTVGTTTTTQLLSTATGNTNRLPVWGPNGNLTNVSLVNLTLDTGVFPATLTANTGDGFEFRMSSNNVQSRVRRWRIYEVQATSPTLEGFTTWSITGGTGLNVPGTSTRMNHLLHYSGAATNSDFFTFVNTGASCATNFYFWTRIALTNITQARVQFGWNGSRTVDEFAASDVALFRYSTAAGDTTWKCITANGGASSTTNNSAVTVTANTDYDMAMLRNGSSIIFYINGSAVATNTTTLPDDYGNIALTFGGRSLDASTYAFRLYGAEGWVWQY